jgi:hypothetical protein
MHDLFIKKYLTQNIVLYPFIVALRVCLDHSIKSLMILSLPSVLGQSNADSDTTLPLVKILIVPLFAAIKIILKRSNT